MLLPLEDIFLELLYKIFYYFVSISHFIDISYHIVKILEVEEYTYIIYIYIGHWHLKSKANIYLLFMPPSILHYFVLLEHFHKFSWEYIRITEKCGLSLFSILIWSVWSVGFGCSWSASPSNLQTRLSLLTFGRMGSRGETRNKRESCCCRSTS